MLFDLRRWYDVCLEILFLFSSSDLCSVLVLRNPSSPNNNNSTRKDIASAIQ